MRLKTTRRDGPLVSVSGVREALGIYLGLALLSSMLVAPSSNAAVISWGAPFVVDQDTDVSKAGNVYVAADFNTAAGFGPSGGVINGIQFAQVAAAGVPGRLTHSFSNGPNNGAAAYAAVAPAGMDPDLVELLDSHAWHAGNPVSATVTLEGLAVGTPYQIQVLGAADTRTCCSLRTYEPDDGAGNFTTGTSIQRGLVQSIIGKFTADAATQSFQWRSLGNAAGNNDPGMSGLVVLAVPEPSCILMVSLLAVLVSIARFRIRNNQ